MVRTLISALTIVLGALLIAVWGVSQIAVKAVEDESVAVTLASTALDSPIARAQISDNIADETISRLNQDSSAVDQLGLEEPIRGAVDDLVESEDFAIAVEQEVANSQAQVADALTDADREPAPLILPFDFSQLVNGRLADIPVVGDLAPEVALTPLPVEVASADAIESARSAYGVMEFAATWFLWAGIALIVLGFLISSRKRWFPAKVLLAVGLFSIGVWALMTYVEPDTLADWIPGASEGSTAAVVVQAFVTENGSSVAESMLRWGLIALAGSAITFLVAAGTRPKKA